MPLNIDIVQILLHMLNFVILAGGLTILLFKPVSKFLAERQAHFEQIARENAEKAQENEELKAEYEKKLAEADVTIEQMQAYITMMNGHLFKGFWALKKAGKRKKTLDIL